MWIFLRFARATLIVAIALSCAKTAPVEAQNLPGEPEPEIWRFPVTYDIPYVKPAGPDPIREQTLDLYLPVGPKRKPPLLIFVHGGFWMLSDDQYRIGPSLASELRASGVAVALVRYRLAPGRRHPAQANDVAAAVAYLAKEAEKYGYDAKRIYLAGHSAGAHLAALIALDPAYLRPHRLGSRSLAGVVAISGIYDLAPENEVSEEQRQATRQAFGDDPGVLQMASPVNHTRADSPPFLVLSAADDFRGLPVDATRFADRLRAAGNKTVQQFTIAGTNHFSIVGMRGENNATRSSLLSFLGVESPP